VTKVPLEVPHDWGTTHFTTEIPLLDPFFMKRRSPLDPESKLSYFWHSPEITFGSGILAQSQRIFLLFSIKLVRFSSNFFDLGANFLIFEKGLLISGYFSPENWLFSPFGEKASHFRD
jgi:hypothetical protein